jgi:general secretion pathway protein N
MRIARFALFAVIGIVSVLATVLWLAPAQWASAALRSTTGGRMDLAETTGSLWNGAATLVLATGTAPGAARASLPERLSWQLSPWPLLVGTVDLVLTHPSALSQPLAVHGTTAGASLGATTVRLPAALLVGLGAPFNTVRPGGLLTITWDHLEIGRGTLRGTLGAQWQYASSALTPVAPMGHYQLQTNGVFPGMTLDLKTLSGPLELTGSGTIAEGGRVRFTGVARALPGTDPAIKTQLTGLISLLGRREGESALLNFGS